MTLVPLHSHKSRTSSRLVHKLTSVLELFHLLFYCDAYLPGCISYKTLVRAAAAEPFGYWIFETLVGVVGVNLYAAEVQVGHLRIAK